MEQVTGDAQHGEDDDGVTLKQTLDSLDDPGFGERNGFVK